MSDLRDVEICRLQEEIRCVRAENERLHELLKGPDPHYDMARENGELRAENARLRAEWRPEKNSLVEERLLDEAKIKLTEAAAFLDELAKDIATSWENDCCMMKSTVDECRAMAAKLRNR